MTLASSIIRPCKREQETIRRLRTYLLALVFAAVVPLAGFSVAVAWWGADVDRSLQRADFQRFAAATAGTVSAEIARATLLIQAMAAAPMLARGELGAFEQRLRALSADTGEILILGDREGRQVINTAWPPGKALSALPRPDLVRQVLATGKPLLTDTISGPITDRHMAGVIVPVPGGTADAMVLAARFDSAQLAQMIPQPKLWPGAFIVVYDGAGAAFAQIGPNNGTLLVPPPPGQANAAWAALADPHFTAAIEPIAWTSWKVALLVPNEALGASWRSALNRLAVAGGVFSGAAAVLAFTLGNFLVSETSGVVAEAAALIEGQPVVDHRGRVQEFEILRHAVQAAAAAARERVLENARLASLSAIAVELEARVAARTHDLEEATGRLLNAQDDERRRIARDLHDSTVQELVAASFSLRAVERASGGLGASDLAEAQASLKRAREELRTVAFLMQPPLLDERGLLSALRLYAEGFADRSGVEVTVEGPDVDPLLPRAVETALFRVVQEALTNVHRHAASPIARVVLRVTPTQASVEVIDEGCGLQDAPPGAGIAGMRARVRQLGGDLAIDDGAGRTLVHARIPISAGRQTTPTDATQHHV